MSGACAISILQRCFAPKTQRSVLKELKCKVENKQIQYFVFTE